MACCHPVGKKVYTTFFPRVRTTTDSYFACNVGYRENLYNAVTIGGAVLYYTHILCHICMDNTHMVRTIRV